VRAGKDGTPVTDGVFRFSEATCSGSEVRLLNSEQPGIQAFREGYVVPTRRGSRAHDWLPFGDSDSILESGSTLNFPIAYGARGFLKPVL
jgi:hypothetical protein